MRWVNLILVTNCENFYLICFVFSCSQGKIPFIKCFSVYVRLIICFALRILIQAIKQELEIFCILCKSLNHNKENKQILLFSINVL